MSVKNQRAFTLIEILISISIIAILSTIGILSYLKTQTIARDARRKQDLRNIKVALELYNQRNGSYPITPDNGVGWNLSTDSVPWIPGLDSTYISALPTDPKQGDCNTPLPPVSNCYLYAYFSTNWPNDGKTKAGQGYILTTKLENTNDKDAGNIILYQGDAGAPWPPVGTVGYYTLSDQ